MWPGVVEQAFYPRTADTRISVSLRQLVYIVNSFRPAKGYIESLSQNKTKDVFYPPPLSVGVGVGETCV